MRLPREPSQAMVVSKMADTDCPKGMAWRSLLGMGLGSGNGLALGWLALAATLGDAALGS